MRKIKNLIFAFLICCFFNISFFILNVNASSVGSYYQVNEKSNFSYSGLNFENVKFIINNEDSSQGFGLIGNITNTLTEKMYYKANIKYYDRDLNILYETKNIYMAFPGNNKFNFLSNISENDSSKLSLITSYSIDITKESTTTKSIDELSNEYSNLDYIIGKYDIDIQVSENNELKVTENISAYFNVPKHGIYRYIPKKNYLVRGDNTTTEVNARIRNIKIDDDYSETIENNNLVLRIGDEDKIFTGEKNYTIKYTYSINKDRVDSFDELYYNIIGTGWDTIIGNVTFSIEMPKNFDISKLGFSSGKAGSSLNNVIYTVQGNKIIGEYNGVLNENEAITVRCELPEGYFTYPKRLTLYYYIFMIIIFAFLVISIYLWKKYGKDDMVVETIEFYPPENLNSAEIGYPYRGFAQNKDVVSLLIYLASKGYLRIIETKEKSLFGKNDKFIIQKVKEYDGNNEIEKMFFEGLFKNHSLRKNKENEEEKVVEVTSEDLKEKFYLTINKILKKLNFVKDTIFVKTVGKYKAIVIIMCLISLCLITVPPVYYYGTIDITLLFIILCPLFGLYIIVYNLLKTKEENDNKVISSIVTKVFSVLGGLVLGGIPFILLAGYSFVVEKGFLIGYVIGIICITIMLGCCKLLTKRTPYGTMILGKIRGFKTFLETAEKDKLEALVNENPTYFYDILPYTYVLGISDKWIKKFESMSISEPDWYTGPDAFDIIMFNHFMNSTMDNVSAAMTSLPANSSSGGGFSGGGFSGGGAGGGGGGSW